MFKKNIFQKSNAKTMPFFQKSNAKMTGFFQKSNAKVILFLNITIPHPKKIVLLQKS